MVFLSYGFHENGYLISNLQWDITAALKSFLTDISRWRSSTQWLHICKSNNVFLRQLLCLTTASSVGDIVDYQLYLPTLNSSASRASLPLCLWNRQKGLAGCSHGQPAIQSLNTVNITWSLGFATGLIVEDQPAPLTLSLSFLSRM